MIPPLYCALWGFWCLNMANWVRYPLPLSERFLPLGQRAKWRCNTPPPPPPQKGYLSDIGAIPHENKAKWVRYPPSAILSRQGISHWAAKCGTCPCDSLFWVCLPSSKPTGGRKEDASQKNGDLSKKNRGLGAAPFGCETPSALCFR